MADQVDSRPSADEETVPLVNHDDVDHPSWLQHLFSQTTKPLTSLSRALLVIALFLLLLSATFVGLFAGAQHRLSERLSAPEPSTSTEIRWTTEVRTETATETRTCVSTKTLLSTLTNTVTQTVFPSPTATAEPRDKPCMSAACILLSASILSDLDATADPCDDFSQFASGGWVKEHPLPADKGLLTNFALLGIDNKRIIERILTTTPLIPPTVPDAQLLTKMQSLYNSCMHEEEVDFRGDGPFLAMVYELEGLLRGDVGESKKAASLHNGPQQAMKERPPRGLTAALAWLHSRGIDALFSLDVEGDSGGNPDLMSLWFSQPGLGLPSKEYYEEKEILELYTSVLTRIFLLMMNVKDVEGVSGGDDEHLARAWPWPWPKPPPCDCDGRDQPGGDDVLAAKKKKANNMAKAVIHFERELARAGADLDVLLQDPLATYNPVPLPNLTSSLLFMDLPTYLSSFAPRVSPSQVIVTHPPFPASLSDILAHTPARVIEDYFIARLALELGPYLGRGTSEVYAAVRTLEEALSGLKQGVIGDRAEFCLKKLEDGLGFAAGRFFVEHTFRGDSKMKASMIIQNVIEAFRDRLPELDWMDDVSSSAAKEKASAMRVKVGYPLSPNTTDATSIQRYYSGVKIHDDKFFENMISTRVHDAIVKWAKLGRRRDREEWEMIPSDVNAYFQPLANEIVFPAGILRPPFFSAEWPNYLSYGSFGSVASHELTHAFDNAGRLYNKDGKLEEWWTNKTSEKFNEHATCISRQYSEYWVEDGKGGKAFVNGNLTSGENIGDAGIALSFRAWQAQYNTSWSHGNEYLLPGLNFTREQLFFISMARTWSANEKPATALQRIRTDPHSPPKFRTNGPLSNFPAFALAFNCSVGSKLNPPPETQCRLW